MKYLKKYKFIIIIVLLFIIVIFIGRYNYAGYKQRDAYLEQIHAQTQEKPTLEGLTCVGDKNITSNFYTTVFTAIVVFALAAYFIIKSKVSNKYRASLKTQKIIKWFLAGFLIIGGLFLVQGYIRDIPYLNQPEKGQGNVVLYETCGTALGRQFFCLGGGCMCLSLDQKPYNVEIWRTAENFNKGDQVIFCYLPHSKFVTYIDRIK